jgi:DNA mismatch repair protein MutS2
MNVADSQTRELLELPAVLERVAQYASFSAARAGVLALRPDADRARVRDRLDLTSQGRQFLEVSPSFSVGAARDVRDRAERAARGARLDPADLLDVHDHLRATRLSVADVSRQAVELPALWSLVEIACDPPDLEGRISAAIDEQAEIRDEASGELLRLRRMLAQARARLTRLLERQIQQVPADVLRERLVTERRGRLTVPVRRERQREFQGVVHDVSASGATVFMEPLAAIEAGNEIRSLEVAEQREIERILLELSSAVGAERSALNDAVQALADLDRTLAVARYADATHAVSPDVSADTSFDLQAARHPLIEQPVPIDVQLDGIKERALVITGANTGGKTVALKTVGLLHLMGACGLHIPVKAGSRIAVFERVVADIGDAQSIEHSLSTFASHVRNLRTMVEAAGPGALALADEIGAGTDPDEGAALGQAVIAALLERGATVVATTHHPALKAFAASHPRSRNASVEFDHATLRPTYRLRLGIPGSSNALEIADRLGVDAAIVSDARTRMAEGALDLEQAIVAAQRELAAAERERAASAQARSAAERSRQELDKQVDELERDRDELLRDARREARGLLREARQTLQDARRAARTGQAGARRKARASLTTTEERLTPPSPPPDEPAERDPLEVRTGDEVEADGFTGRARVLAITDQSVEVAIGSARATFDRARIQRVVPASPRPRRRPRRTPSGGGTQEIDIRGMRADEAADAAERSLDDALRHGAATLRIIHGKGTGALRAVVAEILTGHASVRTHASAPLNEGGDGVTVVALRN